MQLYENIAAVRGLDMELQPRRDLVLIFHRMAEAVLDVTLVIVGCE